MEYIVSEFMKDVKGQYSISKLPKHKLETYIANELLDEDGNILIELPEAIYYSKSVRDSIYRWRDKNRELYNSRRREYYHNRCERDPDFKAFHNERCREYNKKMREKKKIARIESIKKQIKENNYNKAQNVKIMVDEEKVKEIEENGFYTLKFD